MTENKETVLVTGGTGFVGTQIVLQLLQKGYKVKTTMRSLKNKDKLINALKYHGITSLESLSCIETDLTKDDNWAVAMNGCKFVLSVASPVFFETPKDENEAIRPAVDGILRILKFARNAGVKRVVMTSNFGAVGFSNTDRNKETTESDWTNPNEKGLSIYEKSKTLAEKAAWHFIKKEGGDLEFATINAVAILGPSLDEHISRSFVILRNLLDGSMKAVPNIAFNIIDVRDVAELHIRAMTISEANGNRFIASADGQISWPEIAEFLKSKMPNIATKVSTRKLPNFVLNIASFFNKKAKEGKLLLNINRHVSNAKAKNILGWHPIATKEEAILLAMESMIKYKIIQ